MKQPYLQQLFLLLCLSFALYLGTYYFIFCGRILQIPGPVLFQESAFLVTTEFMLKGGNPYRIESLPHYAEIYGPLYPWMMSWLSYFWGCTFFLHRLTSIFFLGLSVILFFLFCRACALEKRFSFLGSLLYFILFANSYSLAARPDTLGTFLLLLEIYIPIKGHFSKKSLGISILCGLFAFLTKPYFIFGILCVTVYLFFVDSNKKAFLYFGLFCGTLVTTIILLQIVAPYYLHSTLLIHKAFQNSQISWFWFQLKEFLLLHVGFFLIAIVALVKTYKQKKFHFFLFQKRAKENAALLLNQISLGCAIGIMLSFMGWHTGAYLIYYFHLLTPFLIISVFHFLQCNMAQTRLFIFGMISLLFNFGVLTQQKLALPIAERDQYTFFENLFASQKQILASPLFAHFYTKNGNLFYDNGHTSFFLHAILSGKYPFPQKLQDQTFQYLQEIEYKLRKASFDIVLVEKNYPSNFFLPKYMIQNKDLLFDKNYVLLTTVLFPCYYLDFHQRHNYGRIPVQVEIWIRDSSHE